MFQVACCFSLRSNLALASPRLCFQVALIKLLWLAALFLHESGQCGHIGEAVAQFLAFAVELEAEVFLHGQAEFERVYGIEAEAAVAEQGSSSPMSAGVRSSKPRLSIISCLISCFKSVILLASFIEVLLQVVVEAAGGNGQGVLV